MEGSRRVLAVCLLLCYLLRCRRIIRWLGIFRCDSRSYTTADLVPHWCEFHQGREDLVGVHPSPGYHDRTDVHHDHGDLARPDSVLRYRDVGSPGVSQCRDAESPYRRCSEEVSQQDTPFAKDFPLDTARRCFNSWENSYYFRGGESRSRISSVACFFCSSSDRIDSGHCWVTP